MTVPKPRSVIEKNNPAATVVNVLMRAHEKGGSPFGPAWENAVMAALHSVPETQHEIVLRDLERRRDVYAGVYSKWAEPEDEPRPAHSV